MRASAYLRSKFAPAAGGMSRSVHMHGHSGLNPMFPRPPMLGGAGNGTSVRPRGGRTPAAGGMSRSVHMHGHSGLNPMFPRPPMLDGAGNGTSAYLLRKSAPAAVAFRRPCLLAINASRLFNARTLAGSSPGTLLKKARHRNGVVLLLFWSGQRDSNPRVSAWEADALPLGDARLCVG